MRKSGHFHSCWNRINSPQGQIGGYKGIIYPLCVRLPIKLEPKRSLVLEAWKYYSPWAHKLWRPLIVWARHPKFYVERLTRVEKKAKDQDMAVYTLEIKWLSTETKCVCLRRHMWIHYVRCRFTHIYILCFKCTKHLVLKKKEEDQFW